MSKIAILKSLPTPADVRQNVQELGQMLADTSQRLDQTARQVQSLEQLPQLVADQVTEAMRALDPILRMRQDVSKVLEAYDAVTKAQRSSLEAMAKELGDRATKCMEAKASALDKTMQDLTDQVEALVSSITAMKASTIQIQALPNSLASAVTQAETDLKISAGKLATQARKVRPSIWLTLSQMLGVATLGALLVAAGQVGLSRLLPPSELQYNAKWAANVWSQATEKEKELLTAIASRPAK